MSPWFNKYSFALSPPTRFFEKYGAELKQSRQIDVFYNANLIDITLSDNLAAGEKPSRSELQWPNFRRVCRSIRSSARWY